MKSNSDDPMYDFVLRLLTKTLAEEFGKIVTSLKGPGRCQLAGLIAVAKGAFNFNQICDEIDVPIGCRKVVYDRLRSFFYTLKNEGVLNVEDNGLSGRARRYKISISDSFSLKPILASIKLPKYEGRNGM